MHRATAACAALLLSILAGCIASEAPPEDPLAGKRIPGLPDAYTTDFPRLRCVDGSPLNVFQPGWSNGSRACNHETTVTNIGNEVTIAVNPTNPDNVVAGAKDYTQPAAGQCVWDGIYSTVDGGQAWKNQQVPGSNWARLQDPSVPVTPLSKHWCATDPVVAFGPGGEAYYVAMGYQCDPVTASKLGAGVTPLGGVNDFAFNCSQMYVLKSTDGGLTWPQITAIDPPGSFPAAFHDRPWIAVGPDNGVVYVAWVTTAVNLFYYSADGGRTFEGPIVPSQQETPAGQPIPGDADGGTMVAAGSGNDVYVSWGCGGGTLVAASHDAGKTFGLPLDVPLECDDDALYEGGRPRTPDAAFPAVDASDGPFKGRLYFVSRTAKFGAADVGFTSSPDGGKTWTPLKRLNDDAAKGAGHFFAAVSVNPHGVVDVAWLDQRNDPDHVLFDLYYTYSLDGGATWAPNARVSEESSDPQWSHHQNGMVFIGDYIDIDSSERYAHPVWVDTRNHVSDVMTAWIERPAFPIGHMHAVDAQ